MGRDETEADVNKPTVGLHRLQHAAFAKINMPALVYRCDPSETDSTPNTRIDQGLEARAASDWSRRLGSWRTDRLLYAASVTISVPASPGRHDASDIQSMTNTRIFGAHAANDR